MYACNITQVYGTPPVGTHQQAGQYKKIKVLQMKIKTQMIQKNRKKIKILAYLISLLFFSILIVYSQYISNSKFTLLSKAGPGFSLYPLCVFLLSMLFQVFLLLNVHVKNIFIHMISSYVLFSLIIRPLLSFMNYFQIRIIRYSEEPMMIKLKQVFLSWIDLPSYVIYGCIFITPTIFIVRGLLNELNSSKRCSGIHPPQT